MNEQEDVYRKLQQHLDNMPIGYPATDSGVEIRLLKFFFTPEEAELAINLNFMPLSLKKIHRRVKKSGITLEKLEEMLNKMYMKGSINFAEHDAGKGLEKYYFNAFLAVGMYEYQLSNLTKEFVLDFEQYCEEGFIEQALSTKINQLRTVPVQQSITPTNTVASYDDLKEILKNERATKGLYAIMDCICNKSKALIGHSCKVTEITERCMSMGVAAKTAIEKGWAREITLNEALALLDTFEEIGLVPQPGNSQNPFFICNCCGDCCEMLTNLKKYDKPSELYNNNYHAKIDSESCTGCGTCLIRCQMDALSFVDAISTVNLDRCIGCGLCVSTCPEDAITLQDNKEIEVPARHMFALYSDIMDKKAEMARGSKN